MRVLCAIFCGRILMTDLVGVSLLVVRVILLDKYVSSWPENFFILFVPSLHDGSLSFSP